MGIVLRSLLDLFEKVSAWIWEPSGCPISKAWMSNLNLGDRATCHECRLFPASHPCHRCGSLFSEPQEYGERLQLHDSLMKSLASPQVGFSHSRLADLAELRQFSSSAHLRCSTYRFMAILLEFALIYNLRGFYLQLGYNCSMIYYIL